MKTLSQILLACTEHTHWPSWLYVQADTQLSPNADAIVIRYDPRTREPLDSIPPLMRKLLFFSDAQDVVINAREQLGTPSGQELVEALEYFILKDAFISFPKRPEKPSRSVGPAKR